MPESIALRDASSAAICAANGVLLRDPLKPLLPELDQATTSPLTSVNVMSVLLKLAFMCTTPAGTLRLTFFFLRPVAAGLVAMTICYLSIK
jgi:hypothetical protein